jgi:hypothetical protein
MNVNDSFRAVSEQTRKSKREMDVKIFQRTVTLCNKIKKQTSQWTEKKREKILKRSERGQTSQALTSTVKYMDTTVTLMQEITKEFDLLKEDSTKVIDHINRVVDGLLALTRKQYEQLIRRQGGYSELFLYHNEPIVSSAISTRPYLGERHE